MSDDQDMSQPTALAQETLFFSVRGESALRMAEDISLKHLHEVAPSLIQGVDGIWTKRVKVDDLGMAHTRLVQTHDNIPVFGGEAVVHLNTDGSFKEMTDTLVRDIDVDTRPRLTDLEAMDIAVASEGGWDKVTGTPELELNIVRVDEVDHLAYRVKIHQFEDDLDPAMPVVFIDAHTGDIVNRYNDLKSARNRRTYNANYGSSLPGTLVLGETSGSTSDPVINQAHTNVGHTYNYYMAMHGRDSFNGAGATIHTTVHYGRNYVNAFWNGSQMVYGDGDGSQSGPLTVLDVVAHELTHAVTDYTSDLVYQNESGALNEAMSDIFAAAVESWVAGNGTHVVSANTWKIGEECWTPSTPGDALRYMNDPRRGGDYDYWPTRYTGTQDNGGVHWNSGIVNLAFYLLSEGGTHPRRATTIQVPGIGIEKAAAIFYRANAVYLTPTSNFANARTQTARSAADLYGAGSAEVAAVHLAWDAVGVPGSPGQPPAPPGGSELQRGQTLSNLSAASNSWLHYYIQVPSGAKDFTVVMSGGTGDGDLYVKRGSQPTTSSYDCRPYKTGNNETCTFATPQAGTYHVSIRSYSTFSGVQLSVDYSLDRYPGPELDRSSLSTSKGNWIQFALDVPTDATRLAIQMTGGSGDGDLHVRKGAPPTMSTYDCRPYKRGNEESCTFTGGVGGTWYIYIGAATNISGVRLIADYSN